MKTPRCFLFLEKYRGVRDPDLGSGGCNCNARLGSTIAVVQGGRSTFGDTLDATTELIPVSGKNMEVTHMITFTV